MKLAITGKGGVGKTTLASTLARLYADEGRTVLAADVDPDANLGLALGLSQEEVDAIVPISKMRTLVEERTGANAANKFFKLNPYVADIPDTFSKEINGVYDVRVVVDEAQQVFRRNGGADEFLVAVVPDLVCHHPNAGNAQILCQALDVVVGLHRSRAGLDHHDELIHVGCRSPS